MEIYIMAQPFLSKVQRNLHVKVMQPDVSREA